MDKRKTLREIAEAVVLAERGRAVVSASSLSLAALFARTFVIGIAVAAPVGAMGMLCIQRTLERGWRTG